MSIIAYLGPEHTFSHLVARKRFPQGRLFPCASIAEVIAFAQDQEEHLGLVPIENSSGGMILETVDLLLEEDSPLFIQEELSLRVRLALVGHPGTPPRIVFSHWAPLGHCRRWIETRFPRAELRVAGSTAEAARLAAKTPGAVALATREAAAATGLSVLHYPVEEEILNLTQFVLLGRQKLTSGGQETSLVFSLPQKPGSLCSFLEPFRAEAINLKRIVSRPVPGQPNTYVFFASLEGSDAEPPMERALKTAEGRALRCRSLGSYPVLAPYES
ncbi:Prephenate dehydratase [Methylacidimicrobium sp. AP8]|uniref:prephenate dehydratase n=1 Tax=Methylacidimicrobium sp. AP8 TaxID=2730359 RepID=UPI0018C15846|nr:prephenate dehydratase domain-containing protein [Methylacidimicrobium sp. AP8]CAB4243428.1 Prephenate dehydratase [Methylacidimicrobium sp. AP8]